jgi:serine/threonine protein kinase
MPLLSQVQELHGSPWQKRSSSKSAKPITDSLETRPTFLRRPSYDLFECIEQHSYLPENIAKYIFAQVVDIVLYLDSLGVVHRDIKDENLLVDENFKVRSLCTFNAITHLTNSQTRSNLSISALLLSSIQALPNLTLINSSEPSTLRPQVGNSSYRHKTLAYLLSFHAEILQSYPYRAQPAEVWSMGVLLSYLITGESPFPSAQDAIEGNIRFRRSFQRKEGEEERDWEDLMRKCLQVDVKKRATIQEIRDHNWLRGSFEDD